MINLENISKQSGIYKFTNKINNKVYIGQAKNLKSRVQGHVKSYKKGNSYFYNSIKKHGLQNFQVEILIEGNFSKTELNEMEITFIRLFKSNNFSYGYNMTGGGDSQNGIKLSEEEKLYLRKINLGKKLTIEHKRKIGIANKGRIYTQEQKNNLKLKRMETRLKNGTNKPSKETREKMSNSRKGKSINFNQSLETKNKMRQAKIGKKLKPESIKKREQTRKFNKNMKLIQENNFIYDWLYI